MLEGLITRFETYAVGWLEYISWLRKAGENDLCRKVFKKALAKVTDKRAEVALEFVGFERAVGNLDSFVDAEHRYQAIVVATLKENESNDYLKEDRVGCKRQKRSTEIDNSSNTPSSKAPTISAAATAVNISRIPSNPVEIDSSTSKRSRVDANGTAVVSTANRAERRAKIRSEAAVTEMETKMTEKAVTPDALTTEKEAKNAFNDKKGDKLISKVGGDGGIHIRNLPFDATSGEIQSLLCVCGSIRDIELVLTKDGKSRGIATVKFYTPAAAKAAVSKFNNYEFKGRDLVVQLLEDTEISTAHPTTVFVSKLSEHTTSEDLKKHFLKCGVIEEVRVVLDKKSGKCKGHAYVQFKDIESMPAAYTLSKSLLHGSVISVLKSKYPAKIERAKNVSSMNDAERGFAQDTTSTHNIPTKITMFKPRNAAKALTPRKVAQGKKKTLSLVAPKGVDEASIDMEGNSMTSDVTKPVDGDNEIVKKNNDHFRMFL